MPGRDQPKHGFVDSSMGQLHYFEVGTGPALLLPAQAGRWSRMYGGLGVEEVGLFGLHGGNKVGAALAAGHPRLVRSFVFAGMSHSIVPDKGAREAMFLNTPAVTDVLDAAGDGTRFPDREERRPASIDLAIDELEAFADRALFYRAAFEHDLEGDLQRSEAPTLILEIVTPREDREVGRQGEVLLATIPRGFLNEGEPR